MAIPRKITIEILTSDESNTDPIRLLLEACQWLQLNYGVRFDKLNNTWIDMDTVPRSPVAPVARYCAICGTLKPLDPRAICFGCIANDFVASQEQTNVKSQSES